MADQTSDIGRRFPVRPSPWEQSQPLLDRLGHWLWDMPAPVMPRQAFPAAAGADPASPRLPAQPPVNPGVPFPADGRFAIPGRPPVPPPDLGDMIDQVLSPPVPPPVGVQAAPAATPGVPAAQPAPEVPPAPDAAPPAQAAPQRRPTVIYRSEPGTREFVFPSRGIGSVDDSGDDFLKQQYAAGADTLRMMQDMGATPLNSPQLRAGNEQQSYLMDAMTKQLSGRANLAQAQAQQAQSQAQQAEVEAKYGKAGQKLAFLNTPGATNADPRGAAALGLQVDPNALLGSYGVGPRDTLAQAGQKYLANGNSPLTPGSPEQGAFTSRYGPEIDAAMAGKPYGWFEGADTRGARADMLGRLGYKLPTPERPAPIAPSLQPTIKFSHRGIETGPAAARQSGAFQFRLPALPKFKIGARTSDRRAEIERNRRGQVGG